MNDNRPTYTDLIINRIDTSLRNWNACIAGDKEILEIYTLDYLSVNLVEQIQRIKRLKIIDDRADQLLVKFSSLLESNKYNLVINAIKGAELDSCLALFENALANIQWSLEKEEEPEFEFEIFDQLTDCLVKRDDIYLVENFVRAHLSDFEKEEDKTVKRSFDIFINTLSKIDKAFKENIEVLALTDKFCRDYTKANSLLDENVYWWFYQPIYKAEEIGIISLLSLKSFFDNKKVNENVVDIAADLNASVQYHVLTLNDKEEQEEKVDNVYNLPISPMENVHEQSAVYEYPLAAKSVLDIELRLAIYVLVINKITEKAEHHPLVSSVKTSQNELSNLDEDTRKVIKLIPIIAHEKSNIPIQPFSIDLHTTPKGCTGTSIGLPAYLEYLNKTGRINISKPIAGTGELQYDGKIVRVDDINLKVKQAMSAGFENILIPRENLSELEPELKNNPIIKSVNDINEAVKIIHLIGHENHPAVERLLTIIPLIKEYQFEVSAIEHKDWQYFIKVSGYNEEREIIVYFNAKKSIKPPIISGKPSGKLYEVLSSILHKSTEIGNVIENLFAGGKILNKEKRNKIQEFLKAGFGNYLQEINEAGCDYRFDIIKNNKIIVKQYSSGTINVIGQSGSAWTEVIEAIELIWEQKLEVSSLKKNDPAGNNESILPANITTWIGVDEAGKGDYYGPLVTAAVFVDPSIIGKLSSMGVKDSKDLSDQKNIELGSLIQEICGDKCYILATMPEKYNELISSSSFKGNSQRLLGWQHRRAMENILLKHECEYAVCDQFGSEYFISEGLKTGKGSKINIIQRPKAESNLAVAAASILARREFLTRLQKMNTEYSVTFPKGASDTKAIVNIAQKLIKQFGKDILTKVAKVHFKTTEMIMDALS